jgi:hypothetical protein
LEKKLNKQAGKGASLPKKPLPSVEVEEVLEHISSPYRWELLEIPPVKPAIPTPKKSHR